MSNQPYYIRITDSNTAKPGKGDDYTYDVYTLEVLNAPGWKEGANAVGEQAWENVTSMSQMDIEFEFGTLDYNAKDDDVFGFDSEEVTDFPQLLATFKQLMKEAGGTVGEAYVIKANGKKVPLTLPPFKALTKGKDFAASIPSGHSSKFTGATMNIGGKSIGRIFDPSGALAGLMGTPTGTPDAELEALSADLHQSRHDPRYFCGRLVSLLYNCSGDAANFSMLNPTAAALQTLCSNKTQALLLPNQTPRGLVDPIADQATAGTLIEGFLAAWETPQGTLLLFTPLDPQGSVSKTYKLAPKTEQEIDTGTLAGTTGEIKEAIDFIQAQHKTLHDPAAVKYRRELMQKGLVPVVAQSIHQRWDDRVVANKWDTKGAEGAKAYLAQYGKNIKPDKLHALAYCAEQKKAYGFADALWRVACSLNQGQVTTKPGKPVKSNHPKALEKKAFGLNKPDAVYASLGGDEANEFRTDNTDYDVDASIVAKQDADKAWAVIVKHIQSITPERRDDNGDEGYIATRFDLPDRTLFVGSDLSCGLLGEVVTTPLEEQAIPMIAQYGAAHDSIDLSRTTQSCPAIAAAIAELKQLRLKQANRVVKNTGKGKAH